MASRPSNVLGAGDATDLREMDWEEWHPYLVDVDERRVFEADCHACDASATVFFEAGRTRPWEHDERTDASHHVSYWRVDQ